MAYDVRPITEKRFRETERLAQTQKREVIKLRVRPEPPRGVRYSPPNTPPPPPASDGVVAWEPPHETRNITHYNIYYPDDLRIAARVPVGQHVFRSFSAAVSSGTVLVSSFNEHSGLESRKIKAEGPVPWLLTVLPFRTHPVPPGAKQPWA